MDRINGQVMTQPCENAIRSKPKHFSSFFELNKKKKQNKTKSIRIIKLGEVTDIFRFYFLYFSGVSEIISCHKQKKKKKKKILVGNISIGYISQKERRKRSTIIQINGKTFSLDGRREQTNTHTHQRAPLFTWPQPQIGKSKFLPLGKKK